MKTSDEIQLAMRLFAEVIPNMRLEYRAEEPIREGSLTTPRKSAGA
jgi:hypothetical protein